MGKKRRAFDDDADESEEDEISRHAEAEARYAEALSISPDYPEAHANAGVVAFVVGVSRVDRVPRP